MSSATLPLAGLALPSTARIAAAGSAGTSMGAAQANDPMRASPDAANAAAPRPIPRSQTRRVVRRIPSLSSDDIVLLQRPGADALAGRREVGVHHRRRAHRDGRLADAVA